MGPARDRGHQSRAASRHESHKHVKDLPVKTREVDVYRSVLLADAGASTQAQPGVWMPLFCTSPYPDCQ
jgi:hypothetical protein